VPSAVGEVAERRLRSLGSVSAELAPVARLAKRGVFVAELRAALSFLVGG